MRYRSFIAVLACLFSWACIDLPEVEQVSETSDAGEPDTPITDSGTPPDASVPDSGTPALTVTLTTSRAVTNGDVQVSASVSGDSPDEVELLVDGVAVATLAPPYELRWSTGSLGEGTHTLSVRATLGERGITSESRTLIVDRTPPRLVSQTPLPGARNVSVHQTVQATFSEPLDPATVSADSVTLLADAGVIGAEVVLAPEGTSLTIQPASLLLADTVLRVSFEGSVTDVAGNGIQALPQDWTWSIPGYLPLGNPLGASSSGASAAANASLQIDASGRPVVAWLDGTNDTYGVRVRRWNGSNWEPLGAVLPIAGGSSSTTCFLETDEQGRLIVAWDEYSTSAGMSIRIRRWNGSTWDGLSSAAVLIPPQSGYDFLLFKGNGRGQMTVAIREAGSSVAVWRWAGSDWSQLGTTLNVDAERLVSSMQVAIDTIGNPVVAWSESATSSNIAAYMRRWNGSTWESIQMPAQSYVRELIVDDSGAPNMDVPVWNGVARSAQVRRWNGSSWVELGSPISAYPGATDSSVMALTFDSQRRLTALVAELEAAGGASAFYVLHWNGSAWEPTGSFLRKQLGSTTIGVSRIAMDPAGQPVLARIEEVEAEPGNRKVHVYTPNN